jgi:hypothetical protein
VESVAVFKLTANQEATVVRQPAHVARIVPKARAAVVKPAPAAPPQARLPAPAAMPSAVPASTGGGSDDWETF